MATRGDVADVVLHLGSRSRGFRRDGPGIQSFIAEIKARAYRVTERTEVRDETERQMRNLSDEWEAKCTTLGRRVSIRMGPRVIAGRAESLDEDGALLLRTEHGHLERIVGGDVTLDP